MKRRDFLAKARAALLLPALPGVSGSVPTMGAVLPKSEWMTMTRQDWMEFDRLLVAHYLSHPPFDQETTKQASYNLLEQSQ